MLKTIIGFTGPAQCGKDTAASYLRAQYGCVRIAFADALKDCAADFFGWDGQKDERGRRLLQVLGTEAGRAYNPDIWVEKLAYRADIYKKVTIPDVRFPNEAEWIRSQGGILVCIQGRGGLEGAAARHESEQHWQTMPVDAVIDNSGTIEDLHATLDRLMVKILAR